MKMLIGLGGNFLQLTLYLLEPEETFHHVGFRKLELLLIAVINHDAANFAAHSSGLRNSGAHQPGADN